MKKSKTKNTKEIKTCKKCGRKLHKGCKEKICKSCRGSKIGKAKKVEDVAAGAVLLAIPVVRIVRRATYLVAKIIVKW